MANGAVHPQDQPLCPEGDVRFWTGIGAGALAIAIAGCLFGLSALFPNEFAERGGAGILARLSGAAATVVWTLLCTAAGSFAFAAVSLVRGRPAGAAVDVASRAFACVAVANLVHLVPIASPALKLVFDGLAFLVSAAFLGRAAFRLRTLDSFAAVAVATGGVAALAAAAYAVVWAIRPR